MRFKSIGSAPVMKNNVFKVTAGNKFQAVVAFLRGQLGLKAGDSLVSAISGLSPPGNRVCSCALTSSSHISTARSPPPRMTRSAACSNALAQKDI